MIDNRFWNLLEIVFLMGGLRATSDNTAYTLRAHAPPFGTLLTSVATSYISRTLSEIEGKRLFTTRTT